MHDDLHASTPYGRYGTGIEYALATGAPAPGSSSRDEILSNSEEFIPDEYSDAGGSKLDAVVTLILALAFLGVALTFL